MSRLTRPSIPADPLHQHQAWRAPGIRPRVSPPNRQTQYPLRNVIRPDTFPTRPPIRNSRPSITTAITDILSPSRRPLLDAISTTIRYLNPDTLTASLATPPLRPGLITTPDLLTPSAARIPHMPSVGRLKQNTRHHEGRRTLYPLHAGACPVWARLHHPVSHAPGCTSEVIGGAQLCRSPRI